MVSPNQRTLKFGVAGIGNAGGGILSKMHSMPGIEVVAAADLRRNALETFERDYGGRGYDSIEKLCQDPNVDAIWIATPNHLHAPNAITAAEHGKHVVVEKPMALSLQEAEGMIEAAEKNGVKLLSGHTRAFDSPVQALWRVLKSGEVGALKAINVFSFTDWMLRPRLPVEVDVQQGGGVAFRQAPHQIDTLRFLGGGVVKTIRGATGTWMEGRMGAPGYYTAYLEFEDGTPATIAYNGYGYFMASELLPWEEEASAASAETRAKIRKAIQDGSLDQGQAKEALRTERYQAPSSASAGKQGKSSGPSRPRFMSDLGLLLVTCERGLLRQSPNGVYVYNDDGLREEPVTAESQGDSFDPTLSEAYGGIMEGKPVFHDGRWGMATLEVQLALMESSRTGREVSLHHQVRVPHGY